MSELLNIFKNENVSVYFEHCNTAVKRILIFFLNKCFLLVLRKITLNARYS